MHNDHTWQIGAPSKVITLDGYTFCSPDVVVVTPVQEALVDGQLIGYKFSALLRGVDMRPTWRSQRIDAPSDQPSAPAERAAEAKRLKEAAEARARAERKRLIDQIWPHTPS